MSSIVIPDLHPSSSRLRAVVTTQWGKSGYRPIPIPKIESYFIDTALDNDADTWTYDMGDPTGQFIEMMLRDSEVRVQLFGAGSDGVHYEMTGLADEISYTDTGTVTLTGRDLSSIATDSTALPFQWRHQKAGTVVGQQAREIGIRQMNLDNTGQVKKLLYTDGSETYWEFWYRLYRREQKWLWLEPNGTLTAGILNYESQPTYYFGTPRDQDNAHTKQRYIPITQWEFRKTTQQRLGNVVVYGHFGDNGFQVAASDPTTRHWIKRPRKIMLDTEAHTKKAALKLAWEEIFESKVGSLELTVTIPDPGFPIRQNRTAVLRIPESEIYGEFFVVGVRKQAGPSGFLCEVRLRQRQYAITRRIPADPKATGGDNPPGEFTGEIGSQLSGLPSNWGDYFVKAAKKWHGPWDYNLFLATLLAICDQETGFQNEREHGGPGGDVAEWYPWAVSSGPRSQDARQFLDGNGRTRSQWEEIWANEPGAHGVSRQYGVGPMQLTSQDLKNQADDLMKAGNRDQYAGGRWHPEWNIMIGAKDLRSCLQAMVGDSGRDIDMWMGVMAYNRGVQGARDYFAKNHSISSYAVSVKAKVYTDPGYLATVKNARDQATLDRKTTTGPPLNPKPGHASSPAALSRLTWLKRSDPSVDIEHVDIRLLDALNNLGGDIGQTIVITSGFRTLAEQTYLYNRYRLSGFNNKYIAAKPGTSNHEKGEACDCTINGAAMANIVPGWRLALHSLQCPVSGDPVHTTLQGYNG